MKIRITIERLELSIESDGPIDLSTIPVVGQLVAATQSPTLPPPSPATPPPTRSTGVPPVIQGPTGVSPVPAPAPATPPPALSGTGVPPVIKGPTGVSPVPTHAPATPPVFKHRNGRIAALYSCDQHPERGVMDVNQAALLAGCKKGSIYAAVSLGQTVKGLTFRRVSAPSSQHSGLSTQDSPSPDEDPAPATPPLLSQHSALSTQDSAILTAADDDESDQLRRHRARVKKESVPDTAFGFIPHYDLHGHPTRGTDAVAQAGGNPEDLMPVNERRLPASDSAPSDPQLDPDVDPPTDQECRGRPRKILLVCREQPERGPLTIEQAAALAQCTPATFRWRRAEHPDADINGFHFDPADLPEETDEE